MDRSSPGTLSIRFIDSGQTIPLRSSVLRPGKPVETVYFEGDHNADSFHLGAFPDGPMASRHQAISVASFYPNRHADFKEPTQYQLRGMATDPAYRGMGAGSQLLRFALNHLKEKQVDLLWCNAREYAIPFYRKLGFREMGPLFMIPDVCLHRVMYIPIE